MIKPPLNIVVNIRAEATFFAFTIVYCVLRASNSGVKDTRWHSRNKIHLRASVVTLTINGCITILFHVKPSPQIPQQTYVSINPLSQNGILGRINT